VLKAPSFLAYRSDLILPLFYLSSLAGVSTSSSYDLELSSDDDEPPSSLVDGLGSCHSLAGLAAIRNYE
jgi:hypothetical protein